jgi:ribosomal protein L21E
MEQFTEGDRVRVDIADETDPDHDRFHGVHGTVIKVVADDAEKLTGDGRDSYLYRVRFEDGTTADFRWRDLRPPIE